MKYFAIVLRLLIIIVGLKMMSLSGWAPNTAPFCSGVGFILIAVYFGCISIFGAKALSCPFFGGCKCEKKK